MKTIPLRLKQRQVDLIERILNVIREDRLRVGDRLPEQALADRCNVSRTPVRSALNVLALQGIAVRDKAGGFRLRSDGITSIGSERALACSEEEDLYNSILRDLEARRIEAAQTIASLQRRYRTSRAIVQSTLQRLSADQLVERAAGQLWLFSPASTRVESIAWSYAFRLVLEPAALLSKNFTADATALAAIRQSHEAILALGEEQIDYAKFEAADFDFHAMIARGSENPYISNALAVHHRKRRTAMKQSVPSSFRVLQSAREHISILNAIEQGQLETAADLMRVHLRMSQAQRPALLGRGVPTEMRGSPMGSK
jgi:DNA-binding GntR family transcriptional regulator